MIWLTTALETLANKEDAARRLKSNTGNQPLTVLEQVEFRALGVAEHFVDELALLRPLCTDGLLSIDRRRIAITDRGRPFVRLVASVFDAYLPAANGGFSPAI